MFGDPVPGVAKECQVTAVSQTKDEAATAAAISTQPIAPAGSQQPPPSDPACLLAAVGMERLKSLQQEIKDAQSRGDITLVQALTNRYSQEFGATSSQQKQCLAAKENAAANVGP